MKTSRYILIETYWNVNKRIRDRVVRVDVILIETYWNVNRTMEEMKLEADDINRDILECKLKKQIVREILYVYINRDILECK